MNTTATNEFPAQWFDGVTAQSRAATVAIDGRSLHVRAADRLSYYTIDGLLLSSPVAGVPLRLALPDGGTLVFRERDEPIAIQLWQPERNLAHRLEQNLAVVLSALVAVALLAFFAYRDGVPWLAAKVAMRVPIAAEAELGESALAFLDRIAFGSSRLTEERRDEIRGAFRRMTRAAEFRGHAELQFRHSRGYIGANALSLPNGTIIVTDQLVDALGSVDDVAAVLAHEIGHLAHRHALEQLLQSSASALLLGAILGDVSGVGSIAAAAPSLFMQLEYSRTAEDEADAYAFALLRKVGSSPARLANALVAITAALCAESGEGDDSPGREECPSMTEAPAYLSTHPDTESRIARARAAAER